MPKLLPILASLATGLLTIVGTTIAIDARKQALRDRIFEIDLKPSQSASDKALRDYLHQQLTDGC